MSSFLKDKGPRLIENGYPICAIYPGEKRPIGSQWQKNPLTKQALASLPEEAGIGILCGIPIKDSSYALYGIDVDAEDEEVITVIEDKLNSFGIETYKRVGRAPRVLYLVRCESGLRKRTTEQYEKAGKIIQLELLGTGQQFVAYGIHAQTQKPYCWTTSDGKSLFREPYYVSASNIPLMSKEQYQELLKAFDDGVRTLGYQQLTGDKAETAEAFVKAAAEFNTKNPMNLSEDKVRCFLNDYRPDASADEYGTWLKVGMALHHQFKGEKTGLRLWDEWSSRRPKYRGFADLEKKWKGFNRSSAEDSVTFRTIVSEVLRSDPSYSMTDGVMFGITDMARRAYGALRYDWCCDTDGKQWYQFDGVHWKQAGAAEIGYAVRLAIRRSLVAEYVSAGGSFLDLLQPRPKKKNDELTKAEKVAQAIKTFDNQAAWYTTTVTNMLPKQYSSLWTDVSVFDADSRYFGVANGDIDMVTGKFLIPSRLRWVSKCTDVPYVPGAKCPTWEKAVKDCLVDPELVSYFKRLLGYTATGSNKEQLFIILYGSGANGKTTLTNALASLFGDYFWPLRTSAFVGVDYSSPNTATTALAPLTGRRFIEAQETKPGARLNVSQLKHLTGGDLIAIRELYEKERMVRPTWTVFLSTNHLPEIEDETNGVWRRVRPIFFGQTFIGSNCDTGLSQKLKAELPGMLNWLIEGVTEYNTKGECPPKKVMEAAATYRKECDYFGQFIENNVEAKWGAKCPTHDLYDAYLRWSQAEGLPRDQIQTRRAFTSRILPPMKAVFGGQNVNNERVGGRNFFTGIVLKTGFDESANELQTKEQEVPF